LQQSLQCGSRRTKCHTRTRGEHSPNLIRLRIVGINIRRTVRDNVAAAIHNRHSGTVCEGLPTERSAHMRLEGQFIRLPHDDVEEIAEYVCNQISI
jgi:hypothetical protein